jgi:hypothetical protein
LCGFIFGIAISPKQVEPGKIAGMELGIKGFRDSGIQGFRDSGIQGLRDSGIQGYW